MHSLSVSPSLESKKTPKVVVIFSSPPLGCSIFAFQLRGFYIVFSQLHSNSISKSLFYPILWRCVSFSSVFHSRDFSAFSHYLGTLDFRPLHLHVFRSWWFSIIFFTLNIASSWVNWVVILQGPSTILVKSAIGGVPLSSPSSSWQPGQSQKDKILCLQHLFLIWTKKLIITIHTNSQLTFSA